MVRGEVKWWVSLCHVNSFGINEMQTRIEPSWTVEVHQSRLNLISIQLSSLRHWRIFLRNVRFQSTLLLVAWWTSFHCVHLDREESSRIFRYLPLIIVHWESSIFTYDIPLLSPCHSPLGNHLLASQFRRKFMCVELSSHSALLTNAKSFVSRAGLLAAVELKLSRFRNLALLQQNFYSNVRHYSYYDVDAAGALPRFCRPTLYDEAI